MHSLRGYKSLPKTNEDGSEDSTSKPGPSTETQDEDQNNRRRLFRSSPAIPGSPKVDSLRFGHRSKKKWTHSCPVISSSEVPISTSGATSGSEGAGNHQSGSEESGDHQSGSVGSGNHQSGSEGSGDHQSGSEGSGDHQSGSEGGGDHQSGSEGSGDHQSGSEGGGDHQSGSEGSDAPQNVGENEGDAPLNGGGDGGDDQQGENEPSANCWASFKDSYNFYSNKIKQSWGIYVFLVSVGLLSAAATVAGLLATFRRWCDPQTVSFLTLFAGGCCLLVVFFWWDKVRGDQGRSDRCWNDDKKACYLCLCIPIGIFFTEFGFSIHSNCENPFYGCLCFMNAMGLLCVFLAAFLYLPDCYTVCCSRRLTRHVHRNGQPLRPA